MSKLSQNHSHKLTLNRERFAREVVINGGRLTEAYERAGYSTRGRRQNVSRRARQLANEPIVAERISDLKAEAAVQAAQEFNVTIEEVVGKARSTYAAATAMGNHSAAVSATRLLAQIGGLLIEREHVAITYVEEIRAMSDETLARTLRSKLSEVGLEALSLEVVDEPGICPATCMAS